MRRDPTPEGRKLNTHRRRRCDSTVELTRVGGVNAPVGRMTKFIARYFRNHPC